MEVLIERIQRYVMEALGVPITVKNLHNISGLPFFLQERFTFYQVHILDIDCLIIIPKDDFEETPAALRKQIDYLNKYWKGEIIYVPRTISPYNRKRLIKKSISFIVPNNQIYLPFLGIHLRERYRTIGIERKYLRPSAQKLVIYYLVNQLSSTQISMQIAKVLAYSKMTLTRVFNELELNGVGITLQEGRERVFQFPQDKHDLWEKVKNLMSNPVKQRAYFDNINFNIPKVKSGLTALAHYSKLSAPDQEVYAISGATWKMLKNRLYKPEFHLQKFGIYELEVWHYDPVLLAKRGVADPFSIYLSLQDSEDERIEAAMLEMMENVTW